MSGQPEAKWFCWLRYLRNTRLRTVIRKDYGEACHAFDAGLHKAATIMAGAVVEGVLLGTLQHPRWARKAYATRRARRSKGRPKIARWALAQMIDVAMELGVVDESAKKTAQVLKRSRNLVHPARQIGDRRAQFLDAWLRVNEIDHVCATAIESLAPSRPDRVGSVPP
jgi:hypothetical protein